jgi:hypothetical protein
MSDDKKRKSDEWDRREREWTEEMRRQLAGSGNVRKSVDGVKKTTGKKFNPRNHFRLMLVCLAILICSVCALSLTIYSVNATLQATISMFSTIISGVIFVVNYGKDIMVTILNAYTKSALR